MLSRRQQGDLAAAEEEPDRSAFLPLPEWCFL